MGGDFEKFAAGGIGGVLIVLEDLSGEFGEAAGEFWECKEGEAVRDSDQEFWSEDGFEKGDECGREEEGRRREGLGMELDDLNDVFFIPDIFWLEGWQECIGIFSGD